MYARLSVFYRREAVIQPTQKGYMLFKKVIEKTPESILFKHTKNFFFTFPSGRIP